MPIGISDLAHSVRKNSISLAAPVQLGHAQQLVAAAFGYKSLAAYQAAQVAALEPSELSSVGHVVIDSEKLGERASELGAAPTRAQLHDLIVAAFHERARRIHIHASHAAFHDYLHEHVKQIVIEDDDVNSEMSNANYDGIDEIYFDFEAEIEIVPVGSLLEIDLDGHVALGADIERPYAGHKVNVEGFLAVERLGRQCFGTVDCQVTRAELDTTWQDDDYDREPLPRSASQAYAELLGLELHEVGNLVDVEPMELDGSSGEMVYGYLLDFTELASPETAQRILLRHSSLRIEVGPGFFEGVRSDEWPR